MNKLDIDGLDTTLDDHDRENFEDARDNEREEAEDKETE